MARPDYVFQTARHVWRNTDEPGVYRSDPGGGTIALTAGAQAAPSEVLDAALKRAIGAWVMSRGGREMNLNGAREPLSPQALDRLPGRPPRRVISIAPSNAEIMAALARKGTDALARLVAVDSGTDYPPDIGHLPRLGQELFVDLDALAALKPDLVLASLTVPGMERNVAGLERLGIPVLVTGPLSLADIRGDVIRVGRVLGLDEAAGAVVADMEQGLAAQAETAPSPREPVRVLLQWWHHPIFTPTASCWSNELISLAGGVNVFRDRPGQSGEVASEAVVAADPEVIFLSWCGVPHDKLNPERVLRRKDLAGVSAVRAGRVHPLDEALVGRPGPRVVEGAARMAEWIRRARE